MYNNSIILWQKINEILEEKINDLIMEKLTNINTRMVIAACSKSVSLTEYDVDRAREK